MNFFRKSGIGNDIKYSSDKMLDYIYYSILGGELHTKIRLKPLLNFLSTKRLRKNPRILELGCGFGINAFEIAKIDRGFEYDGFDLSEDAIAQGRKILQKKSLQKSIRLFCADATKYDFQNENKYDFVLLIDFLEHVVNPTEILSELKKLTHDKTIFLVSVPTKNYKKYFGDDFHRRVGHVHDGYSLSDLDKLFAGIEYESTFHEYSAGFPVNYVCSLYYKHNFGNRYLNFLKNSLLGRLSFLNFLNDEKHSCSLFSVYESKSN